MAAIYEDLADDAGAARARQMVAGLYLVKGDVRAAIEAGEDAVASFRRLGDERSEAALQHLCAQAYMQRFADEEKSREARGMRQPSASQDPREAVRSALRARALFRQLGDATSELQVLD
eukprot:CAMPEP_0115158998 /NCGR_PEP_ID=MMETSP0227-20121206/69928_1 /TAXON_ID=89957 /ORGANISM="Polarella glacialis, Strain CCMP 1383" /LENGTH=118 /DNA_ID=CAMNT_0002570581 /DNA_START=36 /DNA_END=389 /DNA_ORIENTATION=-